MPRYSEEEKSWVVKLILDLHNKQIAALLRSAGLPTSGTKESYRELISEALKDKKLTYAELADYLDTVAPQAKQQIFLYKGSAELVRQWRNPEWVRSRIPDQVRDTLFNKHESLILPSRTTLAELDYTRERLIVRTISRHQGFYRDDTYDEERKNDDGQRVELRAYVEDTRRGHCLFQWKLNENEASLHIAQLPSGASYEETARTFFGLTAPWLNETDFVKLDIPKAIKVLHKMVGTPTQEARFQGGGWLTAGGRRIDAKGAHGAADLHGERPIDEAMATIRDNGSGQLANCYWLPGPGCPFSDEVHVILVGFAGRVEFPVANTEETIRHVLGRIRYHCS